MAWMGIISVALILLTTSSYISQYARLLSLRSSAGLFISAALLAAWAAQAQAANMYYLFRLREEMRYDVPIARTPIARDWYNLTQILVQWVGALVQLILILMLPDKSSAHSDALSSTTNIPRIQSRWGLAAVLVMLGHTLLFLFSIPLGGRTEDILFTIITNINTVVVSPFISAATALAYVCQTYKTLHREDVGALSTFAIALQVVAFLALAASWPSRLVLPENMWKPDREPAMGWVWTWYPWVGWTCVNSATTAIGQAVVLCAAVKVRRGSSGIAGETTPLLAEEPHG